MDAPPFEILGELGRGAMGVVYRARDPRLGRDVALKLLAAETTPQAVERLKREGMLTAALKHPGIVGVHAAGEWNGRPYIAYELVTSSRTLADVLPKLERRGRVEALRDAARALGAAHARGIVHRDVKPENVLVDEHDRVRVADFGIATAVDLERLTRTGVAVGTPLYMSPESVTGDSARVGPHSDVWALGVMLYEALTDEVPFRASGFVELVASIASGQFDPLRSVDPTVPKDLEAICLKALAVLPEDRYADGDALADDLTSWLGGDALPGLPRRRPVALTLAAALALLAGGGAIGFGLSSASSSPASDDPGPALADDTKPTGPATATDDASAPPPLRRPRSLRLSAKQKVHGLACVTDGALITTCDGRVTRFSLPDLKEERSWPVPAHVGGSFCLIPRGLGFLMAGVGEYVWEVASARADEDALLYSGLDLRGRFPVPGTHIVDLLLLPSEDDAIVVAGENLYVLDLGSGEIAHSFGQEEDVLGVALSPDGRLLATSMASNQGGEWGGQVQVWDLQARDVRAKFTPKILATISALAFLADGKTLVAGADDGSVRFFDLAGRELGERLRGSSPSTSDGLRAPEPHPGRVRGFALARSGRLLTLSETPGNRGGVLCSWALADRSLLQRVELEPWATGRPLLLEDHGLVAIPTLSGRVEVLPFR